MLRKQLKFQILFSVLLIFLSGIFSLYYLSSNEIKKTINAQQLNFYTEKVDNILQTLENRYQKLQKTQMVQSYEYSFKEFSINELKKIHYNQNMNVYPFIINEKRFFILHPSLNGDNFETYSSNKEYKKIIKAKEDNFDIKYQDVNKWIIFKHFEKWDWIVGYSVPISLKYEGLQDFNDNFLILALVVVLFISFLIILIVGYVLSPIEKLIIASKKITSGDLTSEVKINGSYELTQLSNSFSIMKDTIKHNIDELENKIEDRTKKLRTSNKELKLNIKNLKLTQNKLIEAEKMASLGNLVAGVAHEINTPVGMSLTGITHFIELNKEIKKEYANDKMTEEGFKGFLNVTDDLAKQININLERTARLVSSFKQVATDQTNEEMRLFNLKEYMEEILLSLKNITKKTNLIIDLKCNDDIIINSYPGAYAQIITNFIINSIVHAYDNKEKGTININVSKDDSNLIIEFKDDGHGIKEKDLEHIFEPFFTTKRGKGGTGLGLNIIYNIITRQLKGLIECTSKVNKGTTFLVTTPLVFDHLDKNIYDK